MRKGIRISLLSLKSMQIHKNFIRKSKKKLMLSKPKYVILKKRNRTNSL